MTIYKATILIIKNRNTGRRRNQTKTPHTKHQDKNKQQPQKKHPNKKTNPNSQKLTQAKNNTPHRQGNSFFRKRGT
jgi:hypothetical protein